MNSGVLGLVAFLSILAIFGLKALLWVWKAEGSHGLLGAGLLSSWAGFLAYLFFLFFVVDTGTLFWLNSALLLGLMGIGEARYEVRLTLPQTLRPVGYLATLALGAFLIYLSLRPLIADIYMKQTREYLGNLHAMGSKEGLEDRLKSARRLADWAIRLNPYEISYYTKVAGIIDVERGMKSDPGEVREKLDEAIVYYSMAIQRNPKMASLYYLRGAGYEAYGDDHLRDAMADFETSVELYPYYYNGNTGLASVAQRLGMRSEEVVAERRLAELFPHYPSNLINLASALYAMGRNQEAITELEKVLKFEPANAEVHYSLGQVYATIGNKERAVAEYGKALEIDPKMTSAQKAVDILEGQVDQSDSNKPKGYH